MLESIIGVSAYLANCVNGVTPDVAAVVVSSTKRFCEANQKCGVAATTERCLARLHGVAEAFIGWISEVSNNFIIRAILT